MRVGGEAQPNEVATIGDALLRAARGSAQRVTLAFADDHWTFAQLEARAANIARGLIGLGIQRGDHVGVLQPNSFDCLASLYGIALAGGVSVPVNGRYRSRELRYLVDNADLRVLLTSDLIDEYVDYAALVNETFPEFEGQDPKDLNVATLPYLKSIVVFGSKVERGMLTQSEFDDISAAVTEEELVKRRTAVRGSDTAVILYTSGTTSQPSGCILSHNACVRTWAELGERWGVTKEDVILGSLPMYHVSGFGLSLLSVLYEIPLLSEKRFDAGTSIAQAKAWGATIYFLAYPTIVTAIIRHPDSSGPDAPTPRLFYANGQETFLSGIQERFPDSTLVTIYGSSEQFGPGTVSDVTGARDEWATCGAPLPSMELKIVDLLSGVELDNGEIGEIVYRGPTTFDGYYANLEKTAASFDSDGWFHSMDLGFTDSKGRLTYTGRSKDMLKVGGENVAPIEVEEHLGTHPEVVLAQVVGIPDERLDEVPIAFVQRREGSGVTADELIEYCRGKIASFKVPRAVSFVDEWPMSATKIQKFRLREEFLAEQSRAPSGDRV
jgi:fatty-acyl-CoA synthase